MPSDAIYNSPPVLWWKLINSVARYTEQTDWRLPNVWALIHDGDYDAARRAFEDTTGLEVDP